MPELPEVETVVRSLRQALLGAVIETVEVRHAGILRSAPAASFLAVENARIRNVERAGKFILLELTGRTANMHLVLHLGMTGQLLVVVDDAPRAKHTHAIFQIRGGRQLRFVDPRRFGRLDLAIGGTRTLRMQQLGIPVGHEPLTISAEDFVALFRKRNAPIKNALLNQNLLRGLGNIYADESLFRAGIHPRAHHLSAPRLLRLRLAVRHILQQAIRAGGSSISDYVSSDGTRGWFQLHHRVYGRTGLPCVRCRGPIRRLVLAGRSAHFCPHCQMR
ncbi:MAG: bifunctional DNA-formamidopyrimidine glycosylase/DNA-(apurinic or apyrimidinic site) lyase [Terriglobales bacterium]